MITDYIIETVENPAFEDNIAIMLTNIKEASGIGPTISDTTQGPMIGTKESNGRIVLHFRLNDLLEGASLITFLEQGMENPKPPVTVLSIRSAFREVNNGTVEEPVLDYLVTIEATKAAFLKYMNDVQDGLDENDNPIMRPPNVSDNLFMSGYFGTDPIELA